MKYLCLVYREEGSVESLTDGEYDAIMAEACAYRDDLRRRGHDLASAPLEPAHAAATLRVRGAEVTIAHGPHAAAGEQLAGFYLIEARDLNEAIRLVSRLPPARLGSVEVRALRECGPA